MLRAVYTDFCLTENGSDCGSPHYPGPEYGLLLFIFPGIITAHLVKRYALRYAFLGALLAIPVCYLLRILYFVRVRTFIQEIAYAGSAIFWCVMGALFYLLIRAIVLHMTKE
ncbi:inner membrane protein YbjM [Ewingella americana]|uniref:inner membrane protein YbjM n=1 Tax=Ewingella americana TaxID=41202 RepID=UPI001F239330|nr:inner membrane protein YbjM [Ewingella americana]